MLPMVTPEIRDCIRSELLALVLEEKPKSRWAKASAFLNSSFGLFVLSTVVIGFGTWMYGRWSAENEFRIQRTTQLNKVEYEIGRRLRGTTVFDASARGESLPGEIAIVAQSPAEWFSDIMERCIVLFDARYVISTDRNADRETGYLFEYREHSFLNLLSAAAYLYDDADERRVTYAIADLYDEGRKFHLRYMEIKRKGEKPFVVEDFRNGEGLLKKWRESSVYCLVMRDHFLGFATSLWNSRRSGKGEIDGLWKKSVEGIRVLQTPDGKKIADLVTSLEAYQ